MKIITGIILSLFSIISFAASYLAGTVVNGTPGTRAAVQIYNPTPNKICVSYITFASVSGGSSLGGADLRLSAGAFGVFINNGYNKYNFTGSTAQIRGGNIPPGSIPGFVIYEFWTGGNGKDHTYFFNPMLSIPPGSGFLITNAFDNEATVTSFQFEDC